MSDTQPKMAIRTTARPLAMEYTVMFDRDIESPNEFQEELTTLRNMLEGDIANIIINTNGGSCATISAFKTIKDKSPAHYHGILEGIAYSAGSAFFLMCDTVEVGEFAEMMIHTAQGGYGSHSQGVTDHGNQMSRTSRKLVETVYSDFLTPEEIEDILKGAEMWLDSDQIKERLEKRDEIRTARLDAEEVAAFNEKYDANSYAEELLQNLTEELAGLDFNLTDVFMSMTDILQDTVSTEVDVVEEEEVEVMYPFDIEEVTTTTDIYVVKHAARNLNVPYGNAIRIETLRKRVLDALNK
jgi:ATP-dependent protease ClpP protease subunit